MSHLGTCLSKNLQAFTQSIHGVSIIPAVFFGGDQTTILDALQFESVMKPLTDGGIKLYTALGNHALSSQESVSVQFSLASRIAYQQAFTDHPNNRPAGCAPLVYSLISPGGDAFFAVLDP
jgi:hypothetical protein